ncbi:MAG: HYR domain-containing protein [Lewinellaceae bacterium]|nr:HYR domain-containing protein [Lewinellaceae bacterium]
MQRLVLHFLDPDCAVEVTPDMVLEGTPVDTSYVVSLATQAGVPIPNLLTAAHIGSTIQATVTDTLTGNSCWGLLIVEDKLPPEIACENIEIPCAAAQYAPDYLANVLGIAAAFPSVFENCSAYTLTYIDSWLDLACNDPQDRSAQLQRVWTATDASGNQATCTQFIYFQRVHVDAVLFPADTTLDCSNPLLGPLYTGQPYVEAYGVQFPLYIGDLACELDITYVDQEIPLCGTSYSVLRTWTVYDDCLPTVPLLNPRTYIQVIFVKDLAGPTFDCPKDTLVSTDPFTCNKSLDLPDVIISDNCSNIAEILAVWTVNGVTQSLAGTLTNFPGNNLWNADTLGVLGYANNLPAGVTTIKYIVTDACGNSSTCTFKVTVSDGVKPWVACDEFTQVSLGNTGVALINASTFDDGSGDYCAPIFSKRAGSKPMLASRPTGFMTRFGFAAPM